MADTDTRKTIVLTGASRGIGHATVKRFSREGWRVITCSRQAFRKIARGRPVRRITSKSTCPTRRTWG